MRHIISTHLEPSIEGVERRAAAAAVVALAAAAVSVVAVVAAAAVAVARRRHPAAAAVAATVAAAAMRAGRRDAALVIAVLGLSRRAARHFFSTGLTSPRSQGRWLPRARKRVARARARPRACRFVPRGVVLVARRPLRSAPSAVRLSDAAISAEEPVTAPRTYAPPRGAPRRERRAGLPLSPPKSPASSATAVTCVQQQRQWRGPRPTPSPGPMARRVTAPPPLTAKRGTTLQLGRRSAIIAAQPVGGRRNIAARRVALTRRA